LEQVELVELVEMLPQILLVQQKELQEVIQYFQQ
jgi:hypothetical protein